jgi:dolichol-phosphate mannosyltransferase
MKRPIRSIAIVIPIYNEAAALPDLFAAIERLKDALGDCAPHVYFVDDHSSDNSPALLHEACERVDWFSFLRLSRRSGPHVAIVAGLAHCTEDCAAFIAADLQDPPELLPMMADLCRAGHDVVWATWSTTQNRSLVEEAASKLFHEIMRKISETGQIPYRASFALLSRRSYRNLLLGCGQRPSLIVEIPRLGYNVATLTFDKPQRRKGRSKWSVSRKILAFADALVASSYLPIRVMSYVGVATSFIGFLGAVVVIALRLSDIVKVEGWTSLMVLVLVFSGLQMLMLGILGEYLWRTQQDVGKRTLYLIEDQAGLPDRPDEAK